MQQRHGFAVLHCEGDFVGGGRQAVGGEVGDVVVDHALGVRVCCQRWRCCRSRPDRAGSGLGAVMDQTPESALGEDGIFAGALLDFDAGDVGVLQTRGSSGFDSSAGALAFSCFLLVRPPEGDPEAHQDDGGDQ